MELAQETLTVSEKLQHFKKQVLPFLEKTYRLQNVNGKINTHFTYTVDRPITDECSVGVVLSQAYDLIKEVANSGGDSEYSGFDVFLKTEQLSGIEMISMVHSSGMAKFNFKLHWFSGMESPLHCQMSFKIDPKGTSGLEFFLSSTPLPKYH